MRYIGIDYGTRKIGVAFSDEAGTMGFPHSILPTTPTVVDEIAALIQEKNVGAAVVGHSLSQDGQENPVAEEIRTFADALSVHAGIPVHFEPEMYTTQAARRMPDGERMKGSPNVDASAAALILTGFLERSPVSSSKEVAPAPTEEAPRISIDDFAKVDVRVGTVCAAERVPDTDKLLKLRVDLGEAEPRQIVSGIAAYVEDPESLIGRQLCFVTNLQPRKIKGLESNGMLFAVGEGDTFSFVVPDRPVPPGTSAH